MKRSAALVPVAAVAVLLLSACDPVTEPAPTSSSSPSVSPTPTETVEPEVQLPADAVLGLTAHATADNGAELDIQLVVLQPQRWNAGDGVARAAATSAWCSGELDESVYAGQNWSFARVDVTATLAAGSAAWPSDLPLQILPLPGGPSIASSGAVHQVQAPNTENEEGYYVPHCMQNAFLDGPGSGSTYLGFEADGDSLSGWTGSYYGITVDGFGEPANSGRVTLSDCAKVITDLGGSGGSWPEQFTATSCQVGLA
jgi:hypothetical protein